MVTCRRRKGGGPRGGHQGGALPKAYTRLADGEGGPNVEASLGLEGPTLSVSKTVMLPAWLKLCWNEQTPFGGLRKTFRRMWLAAESFESLEKQVIATWARPWASCPNRQARVRGLQAPSVARTKHRSLDNPSRCSSVLG